LQNRLQYAALRFLEGYGVKVPLPSLAQTILILFLSFIPLMLLLELFRKRGSPVLNIAVTVSGVCYVSLFLGTLVGLREAFVPGDFPVYRHFNEVGPSVSMEVAATVDRWGGLTVAAVFASIWICDSAAYFAGRAFGKHKLNERVSPHKTWEGAAFGFLFALGAFVAAKLFFLPYLSLADSVVCGCIVGVFGQLGDLVESLLKRDAGFKDSSALVPGHGGVLDRFDSLIFVSPLLFLYLDFLVF
jgi:phosphatidate cytidylyltransferase